MFLPEPEDQVLVESRGTTLLEPLQDGGAVVGAVVDEVHEDLPTWRGDALGTLVQLRVIQLLNVVAQVPGNLLK